MVDLANLVTLVVPVGGAVVAYAFARRQAVLQQRSTLYADALAAMDKLQQGPYRIRNRTTDEPAHRQALVDHVRDVQEKLSHYEFLLRLDSPRVSEAFTRLVMDARELSLAEREKAWRRPPAEGPADMEQRYLVSYDNQFLWHTCIAEMRRELRMVPRLRPDVDPRKAIDLERKRSCVRAPDGTAYTVSVGTAGPEPRHRDRGARPGAWVRVTWLDREQRSSWESDSTPTADEAQTHADQVRDLLLHGGHALLPPTTQQVR